MGGNGRFQRLPWQQPIQLLQEHFPSGLALLLGVFGFGKGQLAHGILACILADGKYRLSQGDDDFQGLPNVIPWAFHTM